MNSNQTLLTHIPRIITVTGGKGGTGKTNIATNLAIALAKRHLNVMLLDADFGLANVDVLLGLKPKYVLEDVLQGTIGLQEALIEGPEGIQVIPGSSGIKTDYPMNYKDARNVIDIFSSLQNPPHVLIVDTSAGLQPGVMSLAMAADEILVVVCNEPTSIADAYALIKMLNQQHQVKNFRIVASQVKDSKESLELFAKLTKVTDKFLNVSLDLVTSIPADPMLVRAVKKQKPVVVAYPNSSSATAFNYLAKKTLEWPIRKYRHGQLEFFAAERLKTLANEYE